MYRFRLRGMKVLSCSMQQLREFNVLGEVSIT